MSSSSNRASEQRRLRERNGERAFLFNADLTACLGEVERRAWEDAVSRAGGSTAAAAAMCGIPDVPRSTKALWGRTKEEARAIYLRWQKQRNV